MQKEIARQLPDWRGANSSNARWRNNGWLIHVKGLEQAMALANRLAPEHLEIVIAVNAAKVAEKIITAGAIFLGNYSPTVLGDYVAGPATPCRQAGRALPSPG